MTLQRGILLLLAIVLVYAGTITIIQIPYKRIYHSIMHPKANVDDVIQKLQSDNVLTRQQGLDSYHYGLQDDRGILDALVQMVVHDPHEESRLNALKLLTSKTSSHLSQQKKQIPLKASGIDQIVSLVTEDNTSPDMLWNLILFAANTAQWQSAPQPVIKRLSALLIETSPVISEEKYHTVLQALKGYARYMMLPDKTLETLLPLYTTKSMSRLSPKIGYIYQYHAINGPLPPTIRQAVVNTMQNSDDKNMRLTAIMTMEWIGKQEGRIPQEMMNTLNNEVDDTWTRNNMNHVIIRMQKHFDDPFASLLTVVNNIALPDSIRANALREAGKDFPQDVRLNKTVIHYLSADAPPIRAAAISLLPNIPVQNDRMLSLLDTTLSDTDPGIRILALKKLAVMQLPVAEKISRFELALEDENKYVRQQVFEILKKSNLSSINIEQRLAVLTESGQLQLKEERHSPDLWQTIIETIKDTRQHGLRLYWVLATAGIIIASFYAIYYVYRLLIYIQQRNRRGYSVIGMLIVWAGLTYATVALFVLGAFMFGHNSLVPPKDQFIIDAMATCVLLIYGFLGWVMGKWVLK